MLLPALHILKNPRMVSLPSISEDTSYDSESSFEEQESDRRRAEKVALLAAAIFCASNRRKHKASSRQRSANKKRHHRDPVDILVEGVNDGHLKDEYRMSKESLLKLHSLLKPFLDVGTQKFRGDTIPSLAKLMMTLRYLAGSRWVDIVRIHCVSRPVVYVCI